MLLLMVLRLDRSGILILEAVTKCEAVDADLRRKTNIYHNLFNVLVKIN